MRICLFVIILASSSIAAEEAFDQNESNSASEVVFDLSGEEIPLGIEKKVFLPLERWQERAMLLKLHVEQDLVLVRGGRVTGVVHTSVESVASEDGKREYFSSLSSRVDRASAAESASTQEILLIEAELKTARPTIARQRKLIARLSTLKKSVVSRPNGVFCDDEKECVMALLPSLNRQRVDRGTARRLLNYADYRSFPMYTASQVYYARTPKNEWKSQFKKQPSRIVMYADGSSHAMWEDSENQIWTKVEFSAAFDGLPTILTVGTFDHPKSPVSTTRATWEKDLTGEWVLRSIRAIYARKLLHPNTTGVENISLDLDFEWSKISKNERKRQLDAESVQPQLESVPHGGRVSIDTSTDIQEE